MSWERAKQCSCNILAIIQILNYAMLLIWSNLTWLVGAQWESPMEGPSLSMRGAGWSQCDLTDSYCNLSQNMTTFSCWALLVRGMEFWEVVSGLLVFAELLLNKLMIEKRSSYLGECEIEGLSTQS